MARFRTSNSARKHFSPGYRLFAGLGCALAALLLSGCALELQNRQAAQEMAQAAKPPGSTYLGWRVFQNRCASCHGPSASGTANGPDLMPRMRDMGSRQFVSVVLKRYDWTRPASGAPVEGASLDTLIDQILQRKDYPIAMPAWEGEPVVNAHLVDLYAYLSARAQGALPPGRPAP